MLFQTFLSENIGKHLVGVGNDLLDKHSLLEAEDVSEDVTDIARVITHNVY